MAYGMHSHRGRMGTRENIDNVYTIDLTEHGDMIYAGMNKFLFVASAPILRIQQSKGAVGHFYYAGDDSTGRKRRRELAKLLYFFGLR